MRNAIQCQGVRGLVSHTHKEIVSAKYKIGSTYHDAIINSIEEKDAELVMHLQFNPVVTGEVTVSEIALYDTSGELFYKKAENINSTLQTKVSL